MKRFRIIGSYITEKVSAKEFENYNEVVIPLIKDGKYKCFGMDAVMLTLNGLDVYPIEKAYDIVSLALLVYIADTRISRDDNAQDSWTREIYVELPVEAPEIWNRNVDVLNRMLKFLTGDIWKLSFSKRTSRFELTDEIRTDEYDAISLFSGGMDSLISTLNLQEKEKNILLVAHANEGLIKKAQTDIVSKLDEKYPNSKHSLIDLWTSIPEDIIFEGGKENTTRSRSFLFIAFAVFVASGTANLKELLVPENGLIAINVPMDSMRVGAHSTRTTHPFYLTLWNDLLKDLGFDFSVKNPFWNKTKGEMAATCTEKDYLYKLMPLSMSCSSPAKERYQGLPPQHCGYCLPCIIRRAAMYKAFGKDNTTYADGSVKEMINERNREMGRQIRSIQYAIERVKEDPEFAEYAILKPGPLSKDKMYLKELADVYYRGLMEVDSWIQDSLEEETQGKGTMYVD